MTRRSYVFAWFFLAAGGGALGAQARPQPQDARAQVPRTHLPPPGMCRIWLDNVPAAQQPAPTDCASAVRNQPRNGRVIFGDAPRNPKLPIVKALKDPSATRKTPDAPDTPAPAKPARPDTKPLIKPDRPEGS
jgi:hypothetical protein